MASDSSITPGAPEDKVHHAAGGRQGDAPSIWVAPDGTVYGINETRTPDGKASVPAGLTSPASGR